MSTNERSGAGNFRRGDPVREGTGRGQSRVVGIFVGVSPGGVEWIAYRAEDFAPMCARLDELLARSVKGSQS